MKWIFHSLFLASLLTFEMRAADPKTILVLGDSIAAGYVIVPEEAFPPLLQEMIQAAGLNYIVVNAGRRGDTPAGRLRRICWLLMLPVDVLLLELGVNDALRGINPGETAKILQGIIEKVRQ